MDGRGAGHSQEGRRGRPSGTLSCVGGSLEEPGGVGLSWGGRLKVEVGSKVGSKLVMHPGLQVKIIGPDFCFEPELSHVSISPFFPGNHPKIPRRMKIKKANLNWSKTEIQL